MVLHISELELLAGRIPVRRARPGAARLVMQGNRYWVSDGFAAMIVVYTI